MNLFEKMKSKDFVIGIINIVALMFKFKNREIVSREARDDCELYIYYLYL